MHIKQLGYNPRFLLFHCNFLDNAINQTISVSNDKVNALNILLQYTALSHKLTLREMRWLVGSFPFITKSIPPGKAFCRRFYDSLSQGHKKQNYVKISKAFRKDVEIWIQFHSGFNGNTHHFQMCTGQAVHLSSDSFVELGCRVINVAMASEDRRNFPYFEQVPIAIHV